MKSLGVTDKEAETFQVAPDPTREGVWLYKLNDDASEAFNRFARRLGEYVQARLEGHTRSCLLAGITNQIQISSIADPDLRTLGTNYPILPITWFKKWDSGATTNKAEQLVGRSFNITIVDGKERWTTNTHIPKVDEVHRWISFVLVDEEVSWRYVLNYKPDGGLDGIVTSSFDSRENDPTLQNVFRNVEDEVQAEMKRRGEIGKPGAINSYWRLKKEFLKSRGIQWRSPGELNPGIYE